MRVLITGGAGFLGSAVANILKQRHHNITVVDNLLYQNDYLRDDIDFKYEDVGDVEKMKRLLDGKDCVIHLAGIVGDAACSCRPDDARGANITSLEILRDHFGGRIIWPSSCSVYGANPYIVNEDSPLNPLSLYAEMKIQGEEILKNKHAFIARLGTLHGVTDRLRTDLVVNGLTFRALTEKKITVFGGRQFRPLLSVLDAARILCDRVEDNISGIYNLVENNYQIIDIVDKIRVFLPQIEVITTPTTYEDSRNYAASNEKFQAVCKLHSKSYTYLGLNNTIGKICDLYWSGRIKNISNPAYSNVLSIQFKEQK